MLTIMGFSVLIASFHLRADRGDDLAAIASGELHAFDIGRSLQGDVCDSQCDFLVYWSCDSSCDYPPPPPSPPPPPPPSPPPVAAPPPVPLCEMKTDMVLVLDSSGSMRGLEGSVRTFASAIVSRLNLVVGHSTAAIVEFANTAPPSRA